MSMENNVRDDDHGGCGLNLPPGFHFQPTDQEILLNFLYHKVARLPCYPNIIPQLDLHLSDPWELQGKALRADERWYFFSRKMENRVTKHGYWRWLDGVDEPIFTTHSNQIGMKKYFEFIIEGEEAAGGGIRTGWVMQEYHLCGSRREDTSKWVLCRVEELSPCSKGSYCNCDSEGSELSMLDELFMSINDEDDETSSPD